MSLYVLILLFLFLTLVLRRKLGNIRCLRPAKDTFENNRASYSTVRHFVCLILVAAACLGALFSHAVSILKYLGRIAYLVILSFGKTSSFGASLLFFEFPSLLMLSTATVAMVSWIPRSYLHLMNFITECADTNPSTAVAISRD